MSENPSNGNILTNEEAINLAKTGTIPVQENKPEIPLKKLVDGLHIIAEDFLSVNDLLNTRKQDKFRDLKLLKEGLIICDKLILLEKLEKKEPEF